MTRMAKYSFGAARDWAVARKSVRASSDRIGVVYCDACHRDAGEVARAGAVATLARARATPRWVSQWPPSLQCVSRDIRGPAGGCDVDSDPLHGLRRRRPQREREPE